MSNKQAKRLRKALRAQVIEEKEGFEAHPQLIKTLRGYVLRYILTYTKSGLNSAARFCRRNGITAAEVGQLEAFQGGSSHAAEEKARTPEGI